MERFYLIKGESDHEVCVLNQKWGSFIHPVNRTISYPETKALLCDVNDRFGLTHPTVTEFDPGFYKITSTANA